MNDPKEALAFALEKYAHRVDVAEIGELAMDAARQNDKRPAWVKVALPDEVVKQLRGTRRKGGDLTLVVHLPGDVLERAESPIILPDEID